MPGRAARDECAAPTVGATRGASAVAMAVETCLLFCLLNLLNVNVNVSLFSRYARWGGARIGATALAEKQC